MHIKGFLIFPSRSPRLADFLNEYNTCSRIRRAGRAGFLTLFELYQAPPVITVTQPYLVRLCHSCMDELAASSPEGVNVRRCRGLGDIVSLWPSGVESNVFKVHE